MSRDLPENLDIDLYEAYSEIFTSTKYKLLRKYRKLSSKAFKMNDIKMYSLLMKLLYNIENDLPISVESYRVKKYFNTRFKHLKEPHKLEEYSSGYFRITKEIDVWYLRDYSGYYAMPHDD